MSHYGHEQMNSCYNCFLTVYRRKLKLIRIKGEVIRFIHLNFITPLLRHVTVWSANTFPYVPMVSMAIAVSAKLLASVVCIPPKYVVAAAPLLVVAGSCVDEGWKGRVKYRIMRFQ